MPHYCLSSTLVRKTVCALGILFIMNSSAYPAERAKVVLLGTGTPIPDPQSSGPAVAVVVNGTAYLFDAGPGVVRRAQAAAEKHNLAALDGAHLSRLFITHLHSDHTLGYPDLILTPWVIGRSQPLEVYGPKGIAAMTEHIKLAYSADINIRTEGFEHLSTKGLQVNVHEIAEPGEIYRDANITVRAIPVPHGSWPQAFGYAIVADGRTIVISGDTGPSAAIAEACRECDVLVHEVYSAERFNKRFSPGARKYHSSFHTSTKELAEMVSKSKPKLLVLYHQLYWGATDDDLLREIRKGYSGAVVSAKDLGIY